MGCLLRTSFATSGVLHHGLRLRKAGRISGIAPAVGKLLWSVGVCPFNVAVTMALTHTRRVFRHRHLRCTTSKLDELCLGRDLAERSIQQSP